MQNKLQLPPTMTAVVITEHGSNPIVKTMPVPSPGKGQVLVKMHASPINPSDLAFIKGGYGIKKPYPVVPGFEGSGVVVAAGKGILPKLWLGKRVACTASSKLNGCWAEYMITEAASCVPPGKKTSLDQASMMFVNPMTALAFFDIHKKRAQSGLKSGAIINTAGASALGKMVIKLGERKNIPVISVVYKNEQVEMLKNEGAKHVLNSNDTEFENQLKELAEKLHATLIFDAVGGNLVQRLLNCAPKGSELIVYGRLSGEPCEIDPGKLISTGNRINGFWLTEWLHEKNIIQLLLNTVKIQRLIRSELSTKIHTDFPPEKISEAISTYKSNMSAGKVLLKFY